MDQKNSNDELRNVMREADYLLKELDEGKSEPQVPEASSGLDRIQKALKQINPRMKTVSKEMLARLEAIDKLVSQGYQVNKIWDTIPMLVNSSGINKSVLATSPPGFSWIAFFFPFSVCTQIKEWSYFFAAGAMYLIGSVFYKVSGWDPTFIISLSIAYQYGLYFPYLRWLAIQNQKTELPQGSSIILGLLLSFACVIPSILFEAIFID
jgi:hypothetical protein